MAEMHRWKYTVVGVKQGFWGNVRIAAVQAELDRMGAQGWELVQMLQVMHATQLVFKRPA